MTVTPTMQKNMKTSVHQAKLGKPPRRADIMLETKAMIQASCHSVSTQPQPRQACRLTMPIEMVASAKGSPMMRPTLNEEARGLL